MRRLWDSPTAIVLLAFGALFVIYYLFSWLSDVVVLFLIGAVIAYLVNPLVLRLEARGFRRDRVIAAFAISSLGTLALVAALLIPRLADILLTQRDKIQTFFSTLAQIPKGLERDAISRLPIGGDVAANGIRAADNWITSSVHNVPETLLAFAPKLMELVLLPFIVYFALLEAPRRIQNLVQICPARHLEKIVSLIFEIDEVLGAYIRGLIIVALTVGLIWWAGLSAFGINYAIEIAVLAVLLNVIPYVGPISVAGVALALAYVQSHDPASVLKILLIYGFTRLMDDFVLQTTVMKNAVELHTLLLLFGLIAAGRMFGLVGLIFAVPFMAIVKEAVAVFRDWYTAESGIQQTTFASYVTRIPYV